VPQILWFAGYVCTDNAGIRRGCRMSSFVIIIPESLNFSSNAFCIFTRLALSLRPMQSKISRDL
jgi:hypothetical protein